MLVHNAHIKFYQNYKPILGENWTIYFVEKTTHIYYYSCQDNVLYSLLPLSGKLFKEGEILNSLCTQSTNKKIPDKGQIDLLQ